jgi:hypothetical protein
MIAMFEPALRRSISQPWKIQKVLETRGDRLYRRAEGKFSVRLEG